MKRTFNRLSFVPAFALSLGLCAFAMPAMAGQNQDPNQTQPQTQRSQTRQKTKSVTGCLEQGADGNYTITSKDGMRYNLEPMQGVKLASHVNHEVTVRGMVSPKSGMTGRSGTTGETGETGGTQQGRTGQQSTSAQTLRVRSVKTISNTCQSQ